MNRTYDEAISQHYAKVAQEQGLSPNSTMADDITRGKETDAIRTFVGEAIAAKGGGSLTIADVGCGNGYTLSVLNEAFPGQTFVGFEPSSDLRDLAASRFEGADNVTIKHGDIREANFAGGLKADIVIVQRVIINILDLADQTTALQNIVQVAKDPEGADAGWLLFIEAFKSSLDKLNEAREEFDLSAIPEAHHNLYLQDGFFECDALGTLTFDQPILEQEFLSTHYFVTRVLHPVTLPDDKGFKRNSEFVRFFSSALKNSGDYSPLKLKLFKRVA